MESPKILDDVSEVVYGQLSCGLSVSAYQDETVEACESCCVCSGKHEVEHMGARTLVVPCW
jgi:hypothetical protein